MFMLCIRGDNHGGVTRFARLVLQHTQEGSFGRDDISADRDCAQEADQGGPVVPLEARGPQGRSGQGAPSIPDPLPQLALPNTCVII
jgi:hypothetical protein